MKRYTFEIVIDEGSDEFWEAIAKNNDSGCDVVLYALRDELKNTGFFDAKITLTSFNDLQDQE